MTAASHVRSLLRKLFLAIFIAFLLLCYNLRVFMEVPSPLERIQHGPAPLFSNISRPPKGFLVWTNNCQIPETELMTRAISKIYKPKEPIICSKSDPLVTATYETDSKLYRLSIHWEVRWQYLKQTNMSISCCYENIKRSTESGEEDDRIELETCYHFHHNDHVPRHIDAVIVSCKELEKGTNIYKEGLVFVQFREDLLKPIANEPSPVEGEKFGILMFGIDTLSQLNFRRTMPKTFSYLQQNQWFEMSGYNKIGDNTFPNLMAILTGLDPKRTNEACPVEKVGGMEGCPFIWKKFRDKGFVTAYSEDEVRLTTFSTFTKGFVNQPTDYYLKPFLVAAEENLDLEWLSNMTFCLGRNRAADFVYDFGVTLAKRYFGERIFGLFWTNSFSHNDFADPSIMDVRFLEYLYELELFNILDHSVVIFFSDHGSRFGQLRILPGGFLESRLPMCFIWLPPSFRAKHPEMVYALTFNRHHLSSPFDMHATLLHLLALSTGKKDLQSTPESCPTCQSLLRPLPKHRVCPEAGIPEHWCTCTVFEEVFDGSMKKLFGLKVVAAINSFLYSKTQGKHCLLLILNSVDQLLQGPIHKKEAEQNGRTFRIQLEASPHEAMFEATFTYYESNSTIFLDVPTVSRLDFYEAHAGCVQDKILKKYCICD